LTLPKKKTEYAIFLASFPPIQSALKITGHGDGMRIQLDIPESQMAEAVKLLLWRETGLRVAIAPYHPDTDSPEAIIGALKDALDFTELEF